MYFSFAVPDPCLSELCDVNAMCIRDGLLNDLFICICLTPFTEGDGFNCSGITFLRRKLLKIAHTFNLLKNVNMLLIKIIYNLNCTVV